MNLQEFIKYKYKDKRIDHSNKEFLEKIWFPYWQEWGLEHTTPEVFFTTTLKQNTYFIDFVIITENKAYLIEIDDHGTHHGSRNFVSKSQDKKNTINAALHNINDYDLPRLENVESIKKKMYIPMIELYLDDIKNDPTKTVDQLHRFFKADDCLNIYRAQKYGTGEIVLTQPQEITLEAINKSREGGNARGIISLTTAVGKTFISIFHVKKFTKDNEGRVLFLAHVNDILDQAKYSFIEAWPEIKNDIGQIYGANKNQYNKKITLATMQSLRSDDCLAKFKKNHFDTIIIDETHRATADSYTKILNHFSPKFILGLTGTHERSDGANVLEIYNDNMIYEITRDEARDKGWIVNIEYHALKDNVDYSNIKFHNNKYYETDLEKLLIIEERNKAILKEYKKRALNKKTIGFCVSIEHAEKMAMFFKNDGLNASAIHSDTEYLKPKQRDKINKAFRNNKIDIIFTVNAFNEGVDFPDVECLLMLRETQSNVIRNQQLGRGLRLSNGKEKVIVLDFLSNDRNQNRVFDYFGTGLDGFKEDKGKYYYDNNGDKVIFDAEVFVECQRLEKMLDNSTSKDTKKFSKFWRDFGNEIEKDAEDNNYWYVGQQEKDLINLLNGIKIIHDNPGINDEYFKVQYAEKTGNTESNSGKRGLFYVKILGLLDKNASPTPAFENILKKNSDNFFDKDTLKFIEDEIQDQLEKTYFYWSLFRGNHDNFKIFLWFTIYKILLLIGKKTEKYEITIDEFKNFVVRIEEHNDKNCENAINLISQLRDESEELSILRFLRYKAHKLDERVSAVFNHNKYINFNNEYYIQLKEEYIEEVEKKLRSFENLLNSKRINQWNRDNSDSYLDMLYNPGTPWSK